MDVRRAQKVVQQTVTPEVLDEILEVPALRNIPRQGQETPLIRVELRWWEPPALTPQEKYYEARAIESRKRARQLDYELVIDIIKIVAFLVVGGVLAACGFHQLMH